jgi:hypothetical protein
MDASLEEMKAWQKEMRACQEAAEACLESKEPTSVEIESKLEHQEVPKEEALVETFGALKDWYVDQYLAVECCRQPKKRTQGNGGSQKKLATTHRQMTHRAIPVHCRGHGHKGPDRDSVARGASKGRMLERRQWTHQEGSSGIRDRDLKEQLCLLKDRTSSRIFRKLCCWRS